MVADRLVSYFIGRVLYEQAASQFSLPVLSLALRHLGHFASSVYLLRPISSILFELRYSTDTI